MLPYSSSMALSFALVVLVRIVVVGDFGFSEFLVAASGDKEMRCCCCCCFERESLLMLLLLEMVE